MTNDAKVWYMLNKMDGKRVIRTECNPPRVDVAPCSFAMTPEVNSSASWRYDCCGNGIAKHQTLSADVLDMISVFKNKIGFRLNRVFSQGWVEYVVEGEDAQ